MQELLDYIDQLHTATEEETVAMNEDPIAFFKGHGYQDLKQIDGKWYGTMRMLFTTALYCDLCEYGNNGGRICFETRADAVSFLNEWDGITAPVVGKKDGVAADKRVNRATE